MRWRRVREIARSGGVTCVHDVAEGGLAVALAECCVAGGIGAARGPARRIREALFGEGPGGFLVAGAPAAVEELAPHASR